VAIKTKIPNVNLTVLIIVLRIRIRRPKVKNYL